MKLTKGQKLYRRLRREGKKHRKQVLHGVIEYKTNRQIAADLSLAIGTVAKHVGHLLTEFGCHNRQELAAFAKAKGHK